MNKHPFRKTRLITMAIVVVFLATTFSTSMAEYIGPKDRSITTSKWERHWCSADYFADGLGLYWYDRMGRWASGGCPWAFDWDAPNDHDEDVIAMTWTDNGYFAGASSSSNPQGRYIEYQYPGARWAWGQVIRINDTPSSCTKGEESCTEVFTTTTYDPATVSGTTSCTDLGNNGWCVGSGEILFTSTETYPSATITGIESASGLLCSGSSCTYAIPSTQGIVNLTYWAVSSHGDTSTQATSSMKFDTVPPSADISISGTLHNGWYNSAVSVIAIGSDATSGVESSVMVVDGAVQSSPFSITTEGQFSAYSTVTDLAGHVTDSPTTVIKRDVTPPTSIALHRTGTASPSGWYNSHNPLTLSVTASDTYSGYSHTDYIATDGNGDITTGTMPFTPADGTYSLDMTHYDVAGNFTTTSTAFKVDITPPTITLTSSGFSGTVTISGNASDDTAGIDSVFFSSDGGTTWEPQTVAPDGTWKTSFNTTLFSGNKVLTAKATDKAGNVSTSSISLSIFNKVAETSFSPESWGVNKTSILSIIPGDVSVDNITVSICDPEGKLGCIENVYQENQAPIEVSWDGWIGTKKANPGEYEMVAKLVDIMGNTSYSSGFITIPYPEAMPTPEPQDNKILEPFAYAELPEYAETPEPEQEAVITNVIPADVEIAQEPKQNFFNRTVFTMAPGMILLGLAGVMGASAVIDPRVAQWKALDKSLTELSDNLSNKTD